MKQPRPDIPKFDITHIGTFDGEGMPFGWCFDGRNRPNSIVEYLSPQRDDGSHEWHLFCGYTVEELREIAAAKHPKHDVKRLA